MKIKVWIIGLVLSVGAVSQALVSAQDGAWGDTATWGGSVPASSDTAIVRDGYTVAIDGETAVCATLRVGPTSSGGTLNIYSGSLTATAFEIDLFNSGAWGIVNQTGGVVSVQTLFLSAPVRQSSANGSADYTISGGSLSIGSSALIGGESEGTFTVSGSDAVITGNDAATLSLDRGTEGSSHNTIVFEMGASNVSYFADFAELELSSDSYIEVDGSAYSAGTNTFCLIDAATVSGTTENLSVSGFPSGKGGVIRIETNGVYLDVLSADTLISVTNGAWDSTSTWDTGSVPSEIDLVIVRDGYAVTVTSGTAASDELRVGASSDGGTLTVSGGSLSANLVRLALFQAGATGAIVQSGGDVTLTDLHLSPAAGQNNADADSSYTVSGGTLTVSDNLLIGGHSSATFTISGDGATISGGGTLQMALNRGDYGTPNTLAFELGEAGVSTFDNVGELQLDEDSYITVDASSYTGTSQTVHLVSATLVSGSTSNLTVTGGTGTLRIETDGVYLDIESGGTFSASFVGVEAVGNDLLKLTVAAEGYLADHSLQFCSSLEDGVWDSIAQSDDGINPYVVSNLTYSSVEGSNIVLYVQATNSAGFFSVE